VTAEVESLLSVVGSGSGGSFSLSLHDTNSTHTLFTTQSLPASCV